MDRQRLEQIDLAFQEAHAIPAADRAAFLAEACAGDDELRQEVESLLRSADRADDFLEGPTCADASWFADLDAPGACVGRYQILSRLGSGGMGRVYLARDPELGRHVALKFLPPRVLDRDATEARFRREASTASALNHPNILTIHEIGRWRGLTFIATEYIDGITLRGRMRQRRLPIGAAIDIVVQVASALAAAHAAGIVHRDIKPENIMVRRDGLVKVLDFGIAKVVGPADGRRPAITTAAVIGTPAYMSPEQARGVDVDGRTDIWSLGVVLFELIAGRPPFHGETSADLFAAILDSQPSALSRFRRGVPVRLDEILSRALAKTPDVRYARVEDFGDDLHQLRATMGKEAPSRFQLPVRSPTLSSHRPAWAAASVVLIALALLAVGVWSKGISGRAPIRALAVIPLTNATGTSDNEYLSDGITDTLIDDLSKLPDVRVMSHTSVYRYKNHDVDARSMSAALGVQAILTGRVTRHDDRISLTLELVDARDNSHLWGERYERPLVDLARLQDELTHDLSRTLRPQVAGPPMRASTHATNPQAYERYLKGRYYVLKATRPEIDTGISYLREAVEVDPTYALAYVGLADAYRVEALAGESRATEELPKAKAAATTAVQLDDTLAEAHAILGSVIFWYDWNWSEAEQHLKRAVALDGNSAPAHEAYANILSYTARHTEALAEIRRAVALDPLNLRIDSLEGAFLINAGRPADASRTLAQTLQLEPTYWFARQYAASARIDQHQYAEAIVEASEALRTSGSSTRPRAFLGYALARAGRIDDARAELDTLLSLSRQRYVSPYNVAMVYEGLDEHEHALAWLERGFQEREPRMVFLDVEPKWNGLRDNQRFNDLLQRIGFTPFR